MPAGEENQADLVVFYVLNRSGPICFQGIGITSCFPRWGVRQCLVKKNLCFVGTKLVVKPLGGRQSGERWRELKRRARDL